MDINAIIALITSLASNLPGIEDSISKLVAALKTSDPDTLAALLAQANADADAAYRESQG